MIMIERQSFYNGLTPEEQEAYWYMANGKKAVTPAHYDLVYKALEHQAQYGGGQGYCIGLQPILKPFENRWVKSPTTDDYGQEYLFLHKQVMWYKGERYTGPYTVDHPDTPKSEYDTKTHDRITTAYDMVYNGSILPVWRLMVFNDHPEVRGLAGHINIETSDDDQFECVFTGIDMQAIMNFFVDMHDCDMDMTDLVLAVFKEYVK